MEENNILMSTQIVTTFSTQAVSIMLMIVSLEEIAMSHHILTELHTPSSAQLQRWVNPIKISKHVHEVCVEHNY